MLLCLNHGHSERLTCTVTATEVWQPLWQHHTDHSILTAESLPRSLIRNPLFCNRRLYMVLLVKWCCQPWFISSMSWFSAGGAHAAKRTIHGRPCIVGPGRSSDSNTIRRRWPRGTTCGVTYQEQLYYRQRFGRFKACWVLKRRPIRFS